MFGRVAVAVLTAIDADDVAALGAAYGLPGPLVVEGIAAGSVNSNYALEAGGTRYFLRLYEEQDRVGAAQEARLLDRLARAGVPVAAPLPRLDAQRVSTVRGKPAALFPWRGGGMRCQAAVAPDDTARVGEALARVHAAGAGEAAPPGRFGPAQLLSRLDRIEASGDGRVVPVVPRLREALGRVAVARDAGLPAGIVHGALFRDNVLWRETGEVSALLDFESACAGTFAYDLAVTVLSWCFGDDLDGRLAAAMCAGYERVRPLGERERAGLHAEAELAALRFTITRITDYAMRVSAGPRVVKDWARFLKRFEKLEALGPAGLRAMLWPAWGR